MRNIELITASAGTGKTTRLAELLDQAIGDGSARPEGVIATTFTRQAAAELQNRARTRLLRSGRAREAQALLAARIGTVNAVCGSLVSDFTFELGLSPELRVLDDGAAETDFKRALAQVVSDLESEELNGWRDIFDQSLDWHFEVRRIIEAARANGLGAEALAGCAARSIASLDECLGDEVADGAALDAALATAIEEALARIDADDGVKLTATYCQLLKDAKRDLAAGRLDWGRWAKLGKDEPSKKQAAATTAVKAAAQRHVAHPRLRAQMHGLIGKLFEVAERGLRAYQTWKQERGLIDYVDQEVLALSALKDEAVRAALADRIDLVMVDEFQDTSPLQLAIFLELATLAKRSVWVGDPKQAIFGFRGTDPALMDAAINALSNPTRDPDLINEALAAVDQGTPVQTLRTSHRSRKSLVEVTNGIFTTAFSRQQDMPVERVEIEAARGDAATLGPAYSYWPLQLKGNAGMDKQAACLAAGVRALLAQRPPVWDRDTRQERAASPADLAILCRTNNQAADVARALNEVGVAAVLARTGLLLTAEAQVLEAGLRLWVDPRDRLAIATLVRIIERPHDADGFVAELIAEGAPERLREHPLAAAIAEARAAHVDADVLTVIDAVISALDLRRLCAGWGQADQRLANLDALRAHATAYCQQRVAGREAPSLVGFLAHMGELGSGGGGLFGSRRADTCARVGSRDAVTISTWHASKGLEWPMVVLFGLEAAREAQAHGVHVMTTRTRFDVSDPLGGRWIHYWPNPYRSGNTQGPVKDAYARSEAHRFVARRAAREALRVLYVGWTRARDRIILSARSGKLMGGLLGVLDDIQPGLIVEPVEESPVRWGGRELAVMVQPLSAGEPIARPVLPGEVRVGLPPRPRPPARLSPSSAPPRPCRFERLVTLGPPATTAATLAVDALGDAMHDFLAADDERRSGAQRLHMATGLLARYGVAGVVEPAALVAAGDRLWRWLADSHPGAVIRREWPLGYRDDAGTRVTGVADLLVEAEGQVVIIDHKSHRTAAAAARHADALGGQLWCYRQAIARVFPGRAVATWIHLPLGGVVVGVELAP